MVPLPTPVAEVFSPLKEEVIWLHGRWICYRQLFAESERRIEMLNECAGTFFFIVQTVLLHDVQVGLSKLTDSARTGTFDNLSLLQLQTRLEAHSDASFSLKTKGILDGLLSQCALFRTWRNKRLAHFDLLASLGASLNPLPGISRQMVEDALSSLRAYMNVIELHYCDSQTGYELFGMPSGGDALLSVLRNGLRYQELVLEDKIPYEDWSQGTWREA